MKKYTTNISNSANGLVNATEKITEQLAWDSATKDEINREIREVCLAAQSAVKYWEALVLIRSNLAEMLDENYRVNTADLVELLAIAHDALEDAK